MQFTDDEIEIIKEVFSDWGSDCPSADYSKVHAIGVKLGVWEEEKPPTEEELRKRKEFQESPLGKQIQELFSRSNDYMKKYADDVMRDNVFFSGEQWPVGTTLKIKLPDDWNK